MFIIKETKIDLCTNKNIPHRQKDAVSVGYYGKYDYYFGNDFPSKYALKDYGFTNKNSAQRLLNMRRKFRGNFCLIHGYDFTFEVLEVDAE